MQWIKHSTFFSRQAYMTEITHEMGNSGSYAVWLLLERAGEVWNGEGQPKLRLPLKEWQTTAQLPEKRLLRVLEILEEHGVLRTEHENKKLTIYADILLKMMDEGARKRRNAAGDGSENIPQPAGLRTDTYKDQEKEKRQNTGKAFSESSKKEVLAFLRRQGIAPESPQAEAWLEYITKQQPNNPIGYLRHILKTNPGFDPRGEEPPESAHRQEKCLHVAEAMRNLSFIAQGAVRESGNR